MDALLLGLGFGLFGLAGLIALRARRGLKVYHPPAIYELEPWDERAVAFRQALLDAEKLE